MAKLLAAKGKTSKLLRVFIQDSSATTGVGLTGLAYNSSGLVAYYIREGDSSATAITLATMTVGTWASGGFKEISSANLPGVYELGIPDAALASGANSVIVMLKGATNMAPVVLEIQLVSFDPNDAVRMGLTALPNANAGANGGLPTGNASGYVTVATNNDKTGYALTQAFPANFSSLAITGGGAVTAGTVSDKTGYSLSVTPPTASTIAGAVWDEARSGHTTSGSFGQGVASVQGNVTGSVGSVTGAVGSVTSGVTVSTNNDKTGYTASSVTDKTGYSLSSAGIQAIWDALTSALTTVGSIGKRLADNIDAAISSITGGGGGGTDWTTSEKQQIRDALGVDGTKTTAVSGQLQTLSGYVDTEVASILAAVDTEVAAIKAKTDLIPAGGPLAASDYTDPDNAGISTIEGLIDTEVAAIKDVTDKLADMITGAGPNYSFDATALQNAPAGEGGGGGVVSLNLDQVVDGDLTVGDVLKAAWGQGAGKWSINADDDTLTIYGPDGTTVYFTFQLDSSTSPMERVPL